MSDKFKDSSLVRMYHHPASVVMMPCKFAFPVTKKELVPNGATVCLKGGECTCVKYGQTLPDDKDVNYGDRDDDAVRFLSNRR